MTSLIYSFFAGISTSLGVILVLLLGKPSQKVLAMLLGFAGGIMMAISVFELLPESLLMGDTLSAVVGLIFGALMMFSLDKILPHTHVSGEDDFVIENPERAPEIENPMLRMGFLILFGIALHNLPEGLAIGAGIASNPDLGLFIAVAIAVHNIPEGIAMAGPLKMGGLSSGKIFLFTLMAGLMTPIGAALGLFVFKISPIFIGASLAFAAGAMIYIVNDELIPQANKLNNHSANLGFIGGLLLGFIFL